MKAQIVSFHCVLQDKLGRVISSTFNQDVITYSGGHAELLRGLAEALQEMKKGEKRRVCLGAKEAYGFYDPQLVIQVPRHKLSKGETLVEGEEIMGSGDDGKVRMFRITQVTSDHVTLDGNHPLAGQDLVFDLEATDARDATHEELAESDGPPPKRYLH